MNKLSALIIASILIAPISSVHAEWRGNGHNNGYNYRPNQGYNHNGYNGYNRYQGNGYGRHYNGGGRNYSGNNNAGVAGALLGLGTGLIIGGAVANSYRAPPPVYYAPPPVYYTPQPTYVPYVPYGYVPGYVR